MNAETNGPLAQILKHLSRLRFRNLFLIAAALLVIDLVIPDFIPLIDEILLGILTMVFWSWRRPMSREREIEVKARSAD